MTLSPEQRKLIHAALDSAFPDVSSLGTFLLHEFGLKFDPADRPQLYDYREWVSQKLNGQGQLKEFLDKACLKYPKNDELAVARKSLEKQTDLTGPLPSLSGLSDLAKAAEATSRSLVAATLKRRWKTTFLFGSNHDDSSPSITVSAMAMLALFEAGDRAAQFICDAVLSARERDGAFAGAWRAQGNTHCHTLNAAWATFACLRTRPSCVQDLSETVKWLTKQRVGPRTGWGYVCNSHAKPRAFYTAYVMNALVEYLICAEVAGEGNTEDIREALDAGHHFLTHEAPSMKGQDQNVLLWSQHPGSTDVCLATTAIATHVLAKIGRVTKLAPSIAKQLPRTVELLAEYLQDGPGHRSSLVLGDGEQVKVQAWPTFVENDPPYWYHYFTPVAGITILDTAGDLGLSDVPSAARAVISTVKWVVDKTVQQDDGLPGIPKSDGDRQVAIWPTVQSIVILRRWLTSLAALLRQPQVLSLFETPPAASAEASA